MNILTNQQRFVMLAKHGIIESNNEKGKYQIQRIDVPEEFALEAGLDFIPPQLKSDAHAEIVFKRLTLEDYKNESIPL